MAAFPEFLCAWVATQPDLVALVASRVSPWQSTRKDAMPRVTYFQVSGDRVRHLQGATAVARQRWQIDCFGPTEATARQVATLIIGTPIDRRLDGHLGFLVGVRVLSCILDDERDNGDVLMPDGGTAFSKSLDFSVAWRPV